MLCFSYNKKEEKIMLNNDISNYGAIQPIKFVKPGEMVQPIRFEEPSKVVSPLAWAAIQEQENGRHIVFKTKDSRLAKHRIPKEVENPESYLKEISNLLDGKIVQYGEQTKTSIIQAVNTGTNLKISPEEHWIYWDEKGKEIKKKEKIVATIQFASGKTERFSVLVSEISSICKIVRKRFAEAIFDYEEKNLERRMENEFRGEICRCKKIICLTQAGWQKIHNRWCYIFKSVNIGNGFRVETKLDIPNENCTKQDLHKIFFNAITMYKDFDVSSVMIAYSFMGVLYKPFEKAGFTPHFLLFLNGKTGSMKTTLGKILFTQLSEPQFRDIPRRIDADTSVSLERGIVMSGRDTVTLLDDFAPAKTEGKKKENIDKLEMIIRMVGDGSSKSRSNVELNDCRGEGVRGMIVVTGELMGQGMSSNLRCFYCRMEREKTDLYMVNFFQENPQAFSTLIVKFAEFVSENWENIQLYIKKQFKEKRAEITKILDEKRLVDSTVFLQIAVEIIVWFLLDKSSYPEEHLNYLVEDMKKGIINCALQSQTLSVEESPVLQYLKVMDSLIKTGSIILKESRVNVSEFGAYDGFLENEFLFLNPEAVHTKIIAFLRKLNKYFPYDVVQIANLLADDGILRTSSNGKGKRILNARVTVVGGGRCNFWKISIVDFYKIVSSDEEEIINE